MSKKIVVITGSPRKKGNTFAMTEAFIKAAFQKSVDKVFAVYVNDPQVSSLSFSSAREMFDKMVCNTEKYLKDYWF